MATVQRSESSSMLFDKSSAPEAPPTEISSGWRPPPCSPSVAARTMRTESAAVSAIPRRRAAPLARRQQQQQQQQRTRPGFRVGGVDPAEYMRAHLAPVPQPVLANESEPCPVFYNVVSNVKLDPPAPVPLLKLLLQCPHSELKSGFGALILRFVHSLSADQARVPCLKESAVTHLCFDKGALGSTGNRSEEEARLACHEFRMFLYATCGMRTNFRRFTVPNMVCSSSVGYCIDLARLHAENQADTVYYPELFPGLFFYYRHVYEDRDTLYERFDGAMPPAPPSPSSAAAQPDAPAPAPAPAPRKQVRLLEDDLVQLHRHSSSSARRDTEEAVRAQVHGMLQNFLPRHKDIMVLVFAGGKIVGLGVHDKPIAVEAFNHVAEVASRYQIDAREAREFRKRWRAQALLGDETGRLAAAAEEEAAGRLEADGDGDGAEAAAGASEGLGSKRPKKKVNYSNPFSKDTRLRFAEANAIEDEQERKARIKQILLEEARSRKEDARAKRRKKTPGATASPGGDGASGTGDTEGADEDEDAAGDELDADLEEALQEALYDSDDDDDEARSDALVADGSVLAPPAQGAGPPPPHSSSSSGSAPDGIRARRPSLDGPGAQRRKRRGDDGDDGGGERRSTGGDIMDALLMGTESPARVPPRRKAPRTEAAHRGASGASGASQLVIEHMPDLGASPSAAPAPVRTAAHPTSAGARRTDTRPFDHVLYTNSMPGDGS